MPKLFCLLFCCALYQYTSAQSIVIAGHLPKTKANSVVLTYNATALDFIEHKEQRIEAALDADRNFTIRIEANSALQFNLQVGSDWILLYTVVFPGDSISIRQKGKSFVITGNHENELDFQYDFNKKYRLSLLAGLKHNRALRKLEPIEFAQFTKNQIEKETAFMRNFHKKHALREAFMLYTSNNINYDNGAELYRYCGGKRKRFLSDSLYLSFIKGLNINNEKASTQNDYLYFMRELMFYTWNSKVDWTNKTEPATAYYLKNQYPIRDSIARINFTGKVLDLAYYINDFEQIRILNFYKGKTIYDSLEARITALTLAAKNKYQDSTLYLRLLSRLAEQTQKKLNPAPDFTVKDLQGNPHKLSDYRGKVVYLDFWSTTCGPCVAEIPALNALIEKYKEGDVVFLSVAFDADLNRLNRFLAKKPINGTVLVEEKGFGSAIAGDYQIRGIPRYCIIDKAGILISEDAPRPSSKPEEIIDGALKR